MRQQQETENTGSGEETIVSAFRMPKNLRKEAQQKCESEDMTFSQLMRRALRKEIGCEPATSEN
jgi:hypothetical protein